ncbi:MAG: dephospho-CoA kinase [Chitinophagales bacterium]|nr:dephospho-CoA kinase [Chitinophagaceae bacterium]MCB9064235.1 dephospho-CoA kinase [Chitinophagales bacterium]
MLKVGITGGIGAGKSVVCQVFKTLGIPVYDADGAARYLTDNDNEVIDAIKLLFGNDIYNESGLNRTKVSELVFSNPEYLERLNAIVHPATIAYGRKWMGEQNAPYAIKEAAIFFESGTYKEMDLMIGVFAPIEVRIARAIARPGMTREKVLQRMSNQIDDAEKIKRCDYRITNDGNAAIIPQVLQIHQELLEKSK